MFKINSISKSNLMQRHITGLYQVQEISLINIYWSSQHASLNHNVYLFLPKGHLNSFQWSISILSKCRSTFSSLCPHLHLPRLWLSMEVKALETLKHGGLTIVALHPQLKLWPYFKSKQLAV